MKRSEAYKYRRNINEVIAGLSDEAALDVMELFLPWAVGVEYTIGDRRSHNGKLYRCEQSHTSQEDWSPDLVPALWTEIFIDEFPAWKQPTGSQDTYMRGDRVSHIEKHWESEIDYNVYEPGVYGWREVEG